jgi:KUP system potassium uptake protein
VIASQSIISGAYSMTEQAIGLGFLPRMNVIHTARTEIGQIYVPIVNWALAFTTLAAVIGFGSSDALAGAFGIAVSLLMAITTVMATFVALQWKVSIWIVVLVNGSLLALDLLFFASTSTKLLEGGWFPLLIATVISFVMLTWRKGEWVMDSFRLVLRQSLEQFKAAIRSNPPIRLPGTAVVLGRLAQGVPLALSENLRHNHVLYEKVFLASVDVAEVPRVPEAERAVVTPIGDGLTRVALRFGFMEHPNVPQALGTAAAQGKIDLGDPNAVTYYTGRETIVPQGRSTRMSSWRESIFAFMHRNAQRPGAYFRIPCAQLMEVGVEFDI